MIATSNGTQLAERENEVLKVPTDLSLAAVVEISSALRQLLADVFGLYLKNQEFSLAHEW